MRILSRSSHARRSWPQIPSPVHQGPSSRRPAQSDNFTPSFEARVGRSTRWCRRFAKSLARLFDPLTEHRDRRLIRGVAGFVNSSPRPSRTTPRESETDDEHAMAPTS
jgi:hypothetical protein